MSKVTVAEKLSAIGNNMARVYDTGFEKGYDQGFEEGKQFGDYAQGFEEGKKAERDAFWEAFQTPTRTTWTSAFYNACWNDDTFYPKYDIVPLGDAANLFRYCGITDLDGRLNECGVTLDTSGVNSLNCAFGASALTVVPAIDLTKCTTSGGARGLFNGCRSLETVRKIILNETVFLDIAFTNCVALKDITFEGVIGTDLVLQYSTKLTDASIESIITHLSDTASGKTLTLSKVAVDNAFMFSGDGGDVPGTDETNPYWPQLRDSKPNWTITLV
jgi:hypothetical protein